MPLVQPSALKGYREILDAAVKTGAVLQISHLGGQIAWPSTPCDALTQSALALIAKARSSGMDVTGDCYPYAAWCTPANAASLDFFLNGKAVRWLIQKRYFLGLDDMEVGSGDHKGMRLSVELLQQLRKEDPEAWIIGHAMDDDLVKTIYEAPFVMVASDGVFNLADGRPSHPRGRGTFPRALKRLAGAGKKLTLNTMIEKMTHLPAQRFGLAKKGHLAPGADADITIFDLGRLDDRAGYLSPDQAPVGIEYVIVAGAPVVFQGALQNALPGRAVRRES
jgi:N-acyl-D-amino-acid deacylase